MNISDRIIALDEALDQVILSRGERLADEMEFAYEPDDQRKGGVGAVLGGAAAAGAAGYGASAYMRGRKKVASGSGAFGQGSKKAMGMKKVMKGDMQKAAGSKLGKKISGSKMMGGKMGGKLKKLAKKIMYSEQVDDSIEFGMLPIPASVYEKASPSKKAKIMALLKSRRAKIIGGGAAAAMGGFAAGRASKKK